MSNMEVKKYNLQQIDKLLDILLVRAKNTSNAKEAGEKTKLTAKEDGLTSETINGMSIQYSIEYRNYIAYLYKKSGNNNKGYTYRIEKKDLQIWFSLLYSIQNKYEFDMDSIDIDNLGDNNEADKGIGRDTSEVTLDKTEEQKEEYPRSDRVIDGESKVNTMPPKPSIF